MFADAPIDRYARGERHALSERREARRGALLRAGRLRALPRGVAGASNEMFSDFREHVIGVPQVAPSFGNVGVRRPGRERGLRPRAGHRASPADRYAFRTSPLRNVALQPAFMHNGAFVRLEDAIRHHLDADASARAYSPRDARARSARADRPDRAGARAARPAPPHAARLSDGEFGDLVDFVRDGLLDPAAAPARLRRLVPERLPSGRTPLRFEFP